MSKVLLAPSVNSTNVKTVLLLFIMLITAAGCLVPGCPHYHSAILSSDNNATATVLGGDSVMQVKLDVFCAPRDKYFHLMLGFGLHSSKCYAATITYGAKTDTFRYAAGNFGRVDSLYVLHLRTGDRNFHQMEKPARLCIDNHVYEISGIDKSY